jgi:hypothetical protein
MNAFPDIAPKLAKLIPLLGSDRDGEVVAAARGIVRALATTGLDLHDFAKMATKTAEPGRPFTIDDIKSAYKEQEVVRWPWQDAAMECLNSGFEWNDWEDGFLVNMCGWRSRISDRQEEILDRLCGKCGV